MPASAKRSVDQSHALQLEMLEMLRVALQSETRAERPVTGDATGPAPEVALIARDLPDKPTFSVEEVGQILGVGRATAYRAVQLGQIPALRLGRRLLIPRTSHGAAEHDERTSLNRRLAKGLLGRPSPSFTRLRLARNRS
jgi:excisionase family DNA binding protein